MKETIDPNRPYNRTEINKVFDKVKAELHKEALKRGQAKYNDGKALYVDGYTGKELRGGDAYEYDHARSAESIFNKYKATHSDKQIAEIVNHRSNIIVTNTDINKFKGKYRFEGKLKNEARVKELGINLSFTKKALRLADLNISCQAAKLIGGFSNFILALFKGLLIFLFRFWKFIVIIILAILLILLCLKLYNWYEGNQNDESMEIKTELNKIDENSKNNNEIIETKKSIQFAEPLDDLTKSVTEISEFNSIVENQNIIPVIGSMFEYNSTNISNSGKVILEGFVNAYDKIDVPTNVLIEGFTCTIGSEEYNKKLGEKRANNLKSQLIDLGIVENRIIIKPIGMQNFVSTNNKNIDLVLNRRSNVTIIRAD